MNKLGIQATKNHITIFDELVPSEMVHLVLSGHKNDSGEGLWHKFKEDAYGTEPSNSGIELIGEARINISYGVNAQVIREHFELAEKLIELKAIHYDKFVAYLEEKISDYREMVTVLTTKYGKPVEGMTKEQSSHIVEIQGKVDVLEATLERNKY